MRLLLDTHVFIWVVDDDARLSDAAWLKIQKADEVYVSSASLWEATIKHQLGKLRIEPEKLAEAVGQSGFLELPIRFDHVLAVRHLPMLHRDPFDRLLVAQALSEPMHLLSADSLVQQYSALVQAI